VVASSCLFLAAKVNESNLKCDDVIIAVQTLLTATQFSVFGRNPKVGCQSVWFITGSIATEENICIVLAQW